MVQNPIGVVFCTCPLRSRVETRHLPDLNLAETFLFASLGGLRLVWFKSVRHRFFHGPLATLAVAVSEYAASQHLNSLPQEDRPRAV